MFLKVREKLILFACKVQFHFGKFVEQFFKIRKLLLNVKRFYFIDETAYEQILFQVGTYRMPVRVFTFKRGSTVV